MHPSSAALGGIAGAALVVLLGFSVLSFVTAEPVHPITGLACIGGFVGTLVALVLLTPTADEPTPPLSGGRPTLATLLERPARTVSILAYTTVWAFLFPTIFRVGGRFLTGSNWLVGPVTTPRAAFLSVELFVLGLYVVTALLVTFFEAGPDGPRDTLIRLAIGAAIYAAGLFVATGLATPLWFRVIPAA